MADSTWAGHTYFCRMRPALAHVQAVQEVGSVCLQDWWCMPRHDESKRNLHKQLPETGTDPARAHACREVFLSSNALQLVIENFMKNPSNDEDVKLMTQLLKVTLQPRTRVPTALTAALHDVALTHPRATKGAALPLAELATSLASAVCSLQVCCSILTCLCDTRASLTCCSSLTCILDWG